MPDYYLENKKKKNGPAPLTDDVTCPATNLCLSKQVSGAGPQLGNTFKPYRLAGTDRCGC